MAVARVTEIISGSKKSFEDAVEQAEAGVAALTALLHELGYDDEACSEDPGLRYLQELARDLRQNVQTGQRPEAVRSAHSIKGVALSLGMDALGETARTIELSLKEEATPVSEATVAPLLAEMDAVCAVLQALD